MALKHICISIDFETLSKVEGLAKELGLNRSSLFRMLVLEQIKLRNKVG